MVGRKIDLKNLGKRFVKSRKKDIADLEYMCYNITAVCGSISSEDENDERKLILNIER